ncbi:hypothetical protein BJ165DRAFT_772547 [Panaeolus papilionaceus]|nr:hypothetical protein BJ165DRAFT_772547 [Panaeolus papilionaceus]
MSSPPPNPGLVPAARHLRALFSTLTDLTGALRALAQEIQEGIEELASSGLNTNGNIPINGYTDSNGNLVVVGSTDNTQENTGNDNDSDNDVHIASLLQPFGLEHIANANTYANADATASADRVITPAVTHFIENLAMLPQSTRDATLRTYL